MFVDVVMPEAGSLLKWHREKGQAVKVGDLLCEIETDKTVITVEAEINGRVEQILVEAGVSGIAAGHALARIDPQARDSIVSTSRSPASVIPSGIDGKGRLAASPRARRLARDAGLDLRTIAASGPRGRIVERDVVQARDAHAINMPSPSERRPAPEAQPTSSAVAESELIELDGMRRTIAERLSLSKRSIPHFYLSVDIELDALIDLRRRINQNVLAVPGQAPPVKLSINDWVVKALGMALISLPSANAIWEDGRIRRFKSANVGVAVAVRDGLYTPVVRCVESKSLSILSREIKAVALRARECGLRSHECEGGAATVSNLGMFGIDRFTAIINPPQSSILAVGAARQKAIVREDRLGVATMLTATLSCDHRVLDGAVGAQLLSSVKRTLEAPFALLT